MCPIRDLFRIMAEFSLNFVVVPKVFRNPKRTTVGGQIIGTVDGHASSLVPSKMLSKDTAIYQQ